MSACAPVVVGSSGPKWRDKKAGPNSDGSVRIGTGHDDPKKDVYENSGKGRAQNRNQDVEDPDQSRGPVEPLGNAAADTANHPVAGAVKPSIL